MRRSKQLAGCPVTDLTISNPLAARFDYPHARLGEIFGSLAEFSYKPDAFGEIGARTAVCSYYSSRQIALSPEYVALTASTSEGYSALFKLLCDPGDEVLIPTPSYPLFDYLVALECVRAVPYRLLYAGNWFIDFEHLEGALSDRTRAIVIVNPNNPTGSYLKRGEYGILSELAGRRGIPLIFDEVFLDYGFVSEPELVQSLAGSKTGLGFSLNGLSKTAGMPQLKLGWIAIHGELKERNRAAERLEHILDTYLSVATPVQRALPELLSIGVALQRQISERARGNLKVIRGLLERSAVHPLHVEGGWSQILQLPGTRSEEYWVTTLLEEYSAVVQPGYFFDIASAGSHIVVSLLTDPDELRSGIESVIKMVEKG